MEQLQPDENQGEFEYQYYQRPLSENALYQQNGQYEYASTAMEHTVVLKPLVPEGMPIDADDGKKSKSSKSSGRLFWGLLFMFLVIACTAGILTGVYVSRQQQQKNSIASSLNDSLPSSSTDTVSSSTATLFSISATSSTTTSTASSTNSAVTSPTPSTKPSNDHINQPTVGLPKDVGNCVSGSYPFLSSRAAFSGYSGTIDASVNTDAYDFIIPYNAGNVQMDGSLKINLVRNNGAAASGAILTTSRYMWYGRFSVTIQAINVGGAITNVITLSDSGDEIDVEICGNPVAPYTNVFYETVGKTDEQKEYFTHFAIINGFDMSVPHTYTIDWKHDSLTWLVDGTVVRTLLKSESLSSLNPSGPKWFPVTPSLIQFGVWDASYAADPRTVDWAGGPIQWGGNTQFTATYSNFQVTCYDPYDNPVANWP